MPEDTCSRVKLGGEPDTAYGFWLTLSPKHNPDYDFGVFILCSVFAYLDKALDIDTKIVLEG
jgi:hypothetical protein